MKTNLILVAAMASSVGAFSVPVSWAGLGKSRDFRGR